MRFTFLFIIGLILVSGFIAYFGDLLGRRMGKKRLALFHLRPRYTAIVVTTITGMLISALALATLISVNSQFKKVFTQGELIIKQNDTLTLSNISLAAQIKTLKQQRSKLVEDVKKRKKEVADARRDTAYATKARDAALKAVTNLEQAIQARQKELIQLKKKGTITEAQLRNKTAELKSVQEKMRVAQRDLADAQRNLSSANEKLAATQYALQTIEAKLVDAEAQVKGYEKLIAEKQAELNNAWAATVYTSSVIGQMRSGELIYRQGDEIVRGTVSPAQLNNGIQAELTALLDKASAKAATAGAVAPPNGRCVSLIFSDSKTGQVILNEKESIKGAVEKISTSFEEVLVQVVCAYNTAKGMQVPVELRLNVNELVYKKGQKIAGTVIDGSSKEVNILFSLTDFLQQDVARTALSAGIVPMLSSDSRTAQGPNPREQFEALMSVVEQIKEDGAPVYIDVCASQDIYSKDQLNMSNMNFVISKDKPTD